MQNSVSIIDATIEAHRFNTDEFPMSKSFIQRICTEKQKERAEVIKVDFQTEIPNTVTVYWDGKLLPALDMRKCKE